MTRDEIDSALAGDSALVHRLVDTLTPVIQARVARTLLRWGDAARDIRQEVEDFTQEVFLALFDDDGKVLRGWRPERGLSLVNYAGLVAERQSVSILRSGKRNPWKEDPTVDASLDRHDVEIDPETVTASREQLRQLWRCLVEELSPLGRQLFELLFLREASVDEVVVITGMSPDAVYAWRSRLRRLAKKIFRSLSETRPPPRSPPLKGGSR